MCFTCLSGGVVDFKTWGLAEVFGDASAICGSIPTHSREFRWLTGPPLVSSEVDNEYSCLIRCDFGVCLNCVCLLAYQGEWPI